MNFNLTIQEAIEAMENGKVCVCSSGHYGTNDFIINKIDEDNKRYVRHVNGEYWLHRDEFYTSHILNKWAIYEEPKQSTPLIQFKENGIKIECYVAHNTSYGHDSYTARFWLENFKKQEECNDWRKALNTFMRLKCNPLAVVAEHNKSQFVILMSFDNTDNLHINSMLTLAGKLSELSPCFSIEEQAEKAISEIGKENILHMFKTFQGIYE